MNTVEGPHGTVVEASGTHSQTIGSVCHAMGMQCSLECVSCFWGCVKFQIGCFCSPIVRSEQETCPVGRDHKDAKQKTRMIQRLNKKLKRNGVPSRKVKLDSGILCYLPIGGSFFSHQGMWCSRSVPKTCMEKDADIFCWN